MTQPTILAWAREALSVNTANFPIETAASASGFECAVRHALADFCRAGGAPGTGEEHRTSLAMGLIGAHLSWYRLLSMMSHEEISLNCLWGTETKKQESISGADFGIAIKLEDDSYNLAYFQAKNATRSAPTGEPPVSFDRFSIDQAPQRYSEDEDLRKFSDNNIEAWLTEESHTICLNQISKNHQMYKLAITNALGLAQLAPGSPLCCWTHYVAWRDEGEEPFTVSLDRIHESFKRSRKTNQESLAGGATGLLGATLKFSPSTVAQIPSLAKLLSDGQTEGAAGWLHLNATAARTFIANWPVIGHSWFVVNDDGGSGCDVVANLKNMSSLSNRTTWTGTVTPPPPAPTHKPSI